MLKFSALAVVVGLSVLIGAVAAQDAQAQNNSDLQLGSKTLHSMAGCYLVDFSYAETESLKVGYATDRRVYDVNRDKSVKEWIYVDDLTPTRLRLQHVLFAVGLDGKVMDGSQLKHTGEDWEFQAPFLYDFTAPNTWMVKDIRANNQGSARNDWTRRITNLDDGLRYQCSAPWTLSSSTAYPEWTCSGYAPIPGRETRDMGRKDYDALARTTRLIAYGSNWLERQDNTKVIDRAGVKENLAKETGKNWYVRLPDSECQTARDFIQPRYEFWQVTREAWDQVFTGTENFIEKPAAPGRPSRYYQMAELEDDTLTQKADLTNSQVRAGVIAQIKKLIADFRN